MRTNSKTEAGSGLIARWTIGGEGGGGGKVANWGVAAQVIDCKVLVSARLEKVRTASLFCCDN